MCACIQREGQLVEQAEVGKGKMHMKEIIDLERPLWITRDIWHWYPFLPLLLLLLLLLLLRRLLLMWLLSLMWF